jgi:hypothetical protein
MRFWALQKRKKESAIKGISMTGLYLLDYENYAE